MEKNIKDLLIKLLCAAYRSGNFEYFTHTIIPFEVPDIKALIIAIENGYIEKMTFVIRIPVDIYTIFIDPLVKDCKDEDLKKVVLQEILFILRGANPEHYNTNSSVPVKIIVKSGMELHDLHLPI